MKLLQNPAVHSLFKDAFDQEILKSAYAHLHNLDDPFRCNLFARMLQEGLQRRLEQLAPEEEVRQASWFADDPVTTRDRLRFAISGRLSDEMLEEHPTLFVEATWVNLIEQEEALSRRARFSPGTCGLSPQDAEAFITEVEAIVIEYGEHFIQAQTSLQTALWEEIQEAVYEAIGSLNLSSIVLDGVPVTMGEFQLLEVAECYLQPRQPALSGTVEFEIQPCNDSDHEAVTSAAIWKSFPYRLKLDSETLEVFEPEVEIQK